MAMPWLVHYKVGRRKGHDLQNSTYVNRTEAVGAPRQEAGGRRPGQEEHRFFCQAKIHCGSLSPGFC